MKGIILVFSILIVGIVTFWLLFSNVLFPIKYRTEILAAAKTYSVEPALIAAVINAESSFDKDKVSPKKAMGLMQLLPSTAASLSSNEIDLFDPKTNIMLGTKYLAYLINKFNDTETALFAYNAGEGNVARWLTEKNETKLRSCPFKETNAYVNKIKNTLKIYRRRI